MSLIVTHLLAAILPLLFITIYRRWSRNRRLRQFGKAFWERQNPEGLKILKALDVPAIPPPFNFMGEVECRQTQLILTGACIEMGVVEFMIQNQPVSEKDLSTFLDLDERSTKAIIELLLASDILKQETNGYRLTPRAHVYLHPKSAFLEFIPPFIHPKRFYQMLKKGKARRTIQKWQQGRAVTPERWAVQQHSYSFPLGFALAQKHILGNQDTVLDVAGGSGAICIALAMEYPELELTLIELPKSLAITKRMLKQYQLTNRIQCVGMNMFTDNWPQGMDAVIFSNIFHDWDYARCRQLAQKAFQSLNPGGKIILIEALLNEKAPGPLWTAHWSLSMAMFMEGKQFRGSELTHLLETERFTDIVIEPLLGYYSVIIGRKPEINA